MSALLSAYGIVIALVIIVLVVIIMIGALMVLPAFIVFSTCLLIGLKVGGLMGGAVIVLGIVLSGALLSRIGGA